MYVENTVGKGEIARNEQFLLFSQCFLSFFGELSASGIKFEIVVCKFFQFWRVYQNLSFGRRLGMDNPLIRDRMLDIFVVGLLVGCIGVLKPL